MTSTSSRTTPQAAAFEPRQGIRTSRFNWQFGRTRNDADTLEESYDLFDVSVARMSNAVIAWTFDPNDEERAAVEDCLS